MFNLFEDIWQIQCYSKEPNDFIIKDTVFLDGKDIKWYFSSKQASHHNKILKKRKENCTISLIVIHYGIQEIYDDLLNSQNIYKFNKYQQQEVLKEVEVATMGRMNQTNRSEIKIKSLTKKELAQLLFDYEKYPELYKEVVIFQNSCQDDNYDIEVQGRRNKYSVEIKQTSSPHNQQKLNIHREKRLIASIKNIKNGLQMIHFQRGLISEISLLFKLEEQQFVLVWCQAIVYQNSSQHSGVIDFQSTENFLYKQELYDQFQNEQIDQQLEKERTLKEKKIQCECCLQIIFELDSFKVIRDKVWKIRVSRGLHLLNQDQIVNKGKILRQKSIYEFVSVCSICYDNFLQMITISNRNFRSKTNHRVEQNKIDVHISVDNKINSKFYDIQFQKNQTNDDDPSLIKLHPQTLKQKVSLLDDFDNLLKELNEQPKNIEINQEVQYTSMLRHTLVTKKQLSPLIQRDKLIHNLNNLSLAQRTQQNEQSNKVVKCLPNSSDSQETVRQKKDTMRSLTAQSQKNKPKRTYVKVDRESIIKSQFDSLFSHKQDFND